MVIGEPLQLNATSNDTTTPGGNSFAWTPIIGLNNPDIFDSVARDDGIGPPGKMVNFGHLGK